MYAIGATAEYAIAYVERMMLGARWFLSSSMVDLVDAAATTMEPHRLTEQEVVVPLPSQFGIVFFEKPMDVVSRDESDPRAQAMSWELNMSGFTKQLAIMTVTWDRVEKLGWIPVGFSVWNVGDRSDSVNGSCTEDNHRLVSMWALASMPRLVVNEPAHVNRADVRRAKRANLPSDVRFIDLRAPEHAPTRREGKNVDWSHRWIVNGHWHQVAYGPGKGQRRSQWYAPYLKGPKDKPLVVKETVGVLR